MLPLQDHSSPRRCWAGELAPTRPPLQHQRSKHASFAVPQSSQTSLNAEVSAPPKLHLLIGITGCVSVHKNIFLIIEKLFLLYTSSRLEIQVVLTQAAEHLLGDSLSRFGALGVHVWYHNDGFKLYASQKAGLGPAILCYDLLKWADVLLVAPLSANTLAKLVSGLADGLLTDVLHAWPVPASTEPASHPNFDNTVLTNNIDVPKPIVAALALTSAMYAHPITKRQLAELRETFPGMCILKPVEKCVDVDGNISMGGMRPWVEVVDFVSKMLGPIEEDDDDEEESDVTNLLLEEHLVPVPPIIDVKSESSPAIKRSNTLSNKELEEHQRLASQNAVLNSLVGAPG